MLFWVLLILFVNSIATLAYNLSTTAETGTLWAALAITYVYFLGITQTGIVISAIMRLTKSGWGRHFSRLGEILTLSFIPVAAITFIIIYIGGMEHLFWWTHPDAAHGGHGLSPWLGKKFFFWRTIISMALFYVMSYVYFRTGRDEEHEGRINEGLKRRLNIMSAFVIILYVMHNTNTSWDFGMMIIKHWDSSIFPPYYWVGNLLMGSAFLFALSRRFIPMAPGEPADKWRLDAYGIMIMGFAMLWTYMFWSQNIVIWYGDLPNLTGPFFKGRQGNYALPFVAMMLGCFVVPFLGTVIRKIKLCSISLTAVAVIVCLGMWLNRYLMIMPVFSDGDLAGYEQWTLISLFFGGGAAVILSFIIFQRFFPSVPVTVPGDEDAHH